MPGFPVWNGTPMGSGSWDVQPTSYDIWQNIAVPMHQADILSHAGVLSAADSAAMDMQQQAMQAENARFNKVFNAIGAFAGLGGGGDDVNVSGGKKKKPQGGGGGMQRSQSLGETWQQGQARQNPMLQALGGG
jgi:hypothetical protein